MGIMPDKSQYGSQTVVGPGWPNVEEETLAAAAASYEALAAKITGTVVPQQQSQMMGIADQWHGAGSVAAMGEATTIIGGHEINATQAAAIAAKLRAMEVTVAKTKTLVNATAEAINAQCLLALAAPNSDAAIQGLVKLGLSQNIADVNANTAELAGTLGVAPNIPNPGAPPMVGAQKAASDASKQGQDGSQQAMQMLSQLGQMAGQLPQMLMQIPQQMMQQVTQPLQSLTSMFGGGDKGTEGAGASRAPLPAFSNHPLAGGSGAGGGSGMVRAASLPGSGGVSSQTSLMAGLVGNHAADVGLHPAASSAAIGGVAPIGAGMGGMGMMGGRGEGGGGGTVASLAIPAPLEYDFGDGDVDDDW